MFSSLSHCSHKPANCFNNIPTFSVLACKTVNAGCAQALTVSGIHTQDKPCLTLLVMPSSMTALLVHASFLQELLSLSLRRNITAGSCPLLQCHCMYEIQKCYKSYFDLMKIFPQPAGKHCQVCILFLNESPH